MTQLLQFPYVVPVLQIIAGVAVLQIITGEKSPLAMYASKKIAELSDELFIAGKNVIYDSPVIAISTALTYVVQEFATVRVPSLSLSMQGAASLKVAFYIAGILTLRSALSPYLQKVMDNREERARGPDENVRKMRHAFVSNIVPIAAGCAAAYYAEVPMKLARTALFTAALIPIVKLLGNGFESFIKVPIIDETFEKMHGWLK